VVRLSETLDRHPPSGDVSSVHVSVLTDGRNCIVDTQQMRCDAVPVYLKDDRHIALSETVVVGPEGTGKAEVARADGVRWKIKAAGYSDVWTIGFLTSPDHANPDP
jgi:hypothetical protein